MKDEKRKEVQICYLTKEEMNDPQRVMKDFTDDLSLEAVRKLIVTMRDVCSTTENVAYSDPKAREDLFYVTDKMIRFFEASYIHLGRINVLIDIDYRRIRHLTVMEKEIFKKNVPGVSNTVPHISLYGKWLALAGFNPGNNVTVVSGHQQIYIVTTQDWEEKLDQVQMRA